MPQIEQINVKKVKIAREAAEKAEKVVKKLDEKKDIRFKVKAQKVPLNKGALSESRVVEHRCTEYKVALPLAIVEGVSRGVPMVVSGDYERLKKRLLHSEDIGYLMTQVFSNYELQSDKAKLFATMLVHVGNEVIQTKLDLAERGSGEPAGPAPDRGSGQPLPRAGPAPDHGSKHQSLPCAGLSISPRGKAPSQPE